MNRVAIMQPTYLPWSGFFGLIESVDIFVILDNVQFAKRSWQQRNQIKTPNGSIWLTIPINSKGKQNQLIRNTIINLDRDFSTDHKKSIEVNYKKAKYFNKEYSQIFQLINSKDKFLAELNLNLIKYFCERFSIRTKIIKASEIKCFGTKANLLCSICKELEADIYLSPPGSKDYLQETNVFNEANILVNYFQFSHPQYTQLWGEFIPYMSIIDMLFNCGDESIDMIRQNIKIEN